ncbi:dihydroorotase [Hanseniaspora vineae]
MNIRLPSRSQNTTAHDNNMSFTGSTAEFDLGTTCDMHVHVRDGAMCDLITPTIKDGGVSVAYIMPNLQPPITTVERVVEYKAKLEKLAPETTFLMSFYLHESLTPELVAEAADLGAIQGIKCYPAGVTTNSNQGVDPNDFSKFYPIFRVMEEKNLVLNLHGEKPPVADGDITVLNAEAEFLPALKKLHQDLPNLKIVLEHCTTADACEMIQEINSDNVVASITAHHLSLIIDDWCGNPINFCKPVAKLPKDKRKLIEVALSGDKHFFFGSDSAPHPVENKGKCCGCAAGVFTSKYCIPYIAQVFQEHQGDFNNFKKFVSENALNFYKPANIKSQKHCILYKNEVQITNEISQGDIKVVPFKFGEKLDWDIKWA